MKIKEIINKPVNCLFFELPLWYVVLFITWFIVIFLVCSLSYFIAIVCAFITMFIFPMILMGG